MSAGVSVAVWLVYSWPLPRFLGAGIPSTADNLEKGSVRRMIPGDHLQLLYNYWLFSDMAAGRTPPFHNLYEFNTGRDAERRQPGPYNFPFSVPFTAGYWAGGRALGWNLTGLIFLWLSYLWTWLLVRRYEPRDWLAALAALLVIVLPYRWVTLCGGSPTGNSMAWVPLLLLGVDGAVRYGRIGGGLTAGLALLFAFWNDNHVFFFSFLLIPGWVLVALASRGDPSWHDAAAWRRLAVALVPVLVACVALLVLSHVQKRTALVGSTMGQGPSVDEIALYSPHSRGLTEWAAPGNSRPIYLGWPLVALVLAGSGAVLVRAARRVLDRRAGPPGEPDTGRRLLVQTLLVVAVLLVIALALGTRGPWRGEVFRRARSLIPAYAFIRQPAKIYGVLPPLLAVAAGLGLGSLLDLRPGRRWVRGLAAILILLPVADFACRIRPTVCLLDSAQAGYAAVAEDAKSGGGVPRAIGVPLWPGNSAWASLYEHYGSLYRIRMINGYRPAVPTAYVQEVFDGFGSVNLGVLSDPQIDDLLRRGIRHLLLHEDAFPEQVSAFPVGFTLKRFLNHPRLRLLRQAENVWAFTLLSAPDLRPEVLPEWDRFFPTRTVEAESGAATAGATTGPDPTASSEGVVALRSSGARLLARRYRLWHAPAPAMLVRVRGPGAMRVELRRDDQAGDPMLAAVGSERWTWLEFPFSTCEWVEPRFEGVDGEVAIDLIVFRSGPGMDLTPGGSVSVPAGLFFHAGYTDFACGGVCLRPDREPDRGILYGPRLPFPDGDYTARLHFRTGAEPGTRLGEFYVENRCGYRTDPVPVVAGQVAEAAFSTRASNLPVQIMFVYSREAAMTIERVEFVRRE